MNGLSRYRWRTRAQRSQILCTDSSSRSFDLGLILYNRDTQLNPSRVFLGVSVNKYPMKKLCCYFDRTGNRELSWSHGRKHVKNVFSWYLNVLKFSKDFLDSSSYSITIIVELVLDGRGWQTAMYSGENSPRLP